MAGGSIMKRVEREAARKDGRRTRDEGKAIRIARIVGGSVMLSESRNTGQ